MSILGYRAKRTFVFAVCLVILLAVSGTIFIKGITAPSPTGTWAAAGNGQNLSSPRAGAATVQLQDGRILITGGDNGSGAVATADIYDTLGNFSAAAPMNVARSQHTATLLQDGTVLVAGGLGSSGSAINSAEIYNPPTNTWTATTGTLNTARSGHTATALPDGTVLIAGGDNSGTPLSSLEIYNPTSGTFGTVNGSLSSPREQHAAAALQTGDVILAGGFNGSAALATTDIYSFSSKAVSPGPVMATPRQGLTATTQLDGNVLIAGGNNGSANGNQDLASAEVYSESAGTFTLTGNLTTARQGHLAFLLPHNGATLIVGGTTTVSGAETATSSSELYYPLASGTAASPSWNGTFNATGAMLSPRVGATGSPLSNGTPSSVNDGILLVAGGKDSTGSPLGTGELYGFAWVKTDATDYFPGTTVNITGGGWQPGETVTLHFQESPYYDSHPDLTAVADSNGNISNSQFSPDLHDIDIRFYLTAAGSTSGSLAQTTFTDANNVTVTLAISGVSGTVSNNQNSNTCSWNGTAQSGSGCSITVPQPDSILFTASSGASWSTIPQYTLTGCTNGSTTCSLMTGGNRNGTLSVILLVSTTTTITNSSTLSSTASVVGQPYAVNYTVTSGGGTIPGTETVTVSDGTSTCTGTIGAGTCNLTSTSAGSKTITAAYGGDTNFTASTSTGVSHTVNQAATTTTITNSLATATVVGQAYAVNYSVVVKSPGTGTIPGTDTVTVSDGTATCTGTVTAGTCNLTSTSAGAKTITATYNGDTNFATSTSSGVSHTVNQAATTTTIPNSSSLSATSTVVGQGEVVDFSVTVNSPGAGTVSGTDTVTVSDGTSSCTATVSAGNCVLTYTSAGAKTVTAKYNGDTNFAVSTSTGASHTVNQATTTTTITNASSLATASVVGQAYAVNYSVAVNSPGSGTIPVAETVTVSDGTSTCTGTVTAGTCNLTSSTPGSKTITAAYSGDTNFAASTSTGVSHTVNSPATTTSLGSTPNPSTYGQPVTFTATVTSGGGTPTGSVTFVGGSSCSGSALTGSTSNPASLNGSGVATFATSALPGGAQTITACYSPTGIFTASNGSVSQVVNPIAQMITFTAPASPVTFGIAPITLSASSTSGLPVVFTIDNTSTATGSIAGSMLTITKAGTLVIDANQSGNNNYQPATQVQNTIVVNPANYVVTVSSDDAGTASNCTPQSTAGHGTDASCSLRDALLEAAAGGGGNISFDATVFSSPTTITLTNGTLTVPTATNITGATSGSGASLANLVSVDGNNASTVFTVGSGVTGASISNLIIQHGASGQANTAGGIINNGALTLNADSIVNNAGQYAGGIYNAGTLVMTASTVYHNAQTNPNGGFGGGIINYGTLTLIDDTIEGNAAYSGAGIANGNISLTLGGNLTIADSTISGNTSNPGTGGGILENLGSINVKNSVLSGNLSNDIQGAYTDGGGNVIGRVNGTIIDGTPINLAPLGNYGGPTQTLIPLPGSPAICAGLQSKIPSNLTTDQRGLPNTASYPSDSTCVDAGAVQTNYAISFSGEPPALSPVNTNFAAAVTLTESGAPFAPAVTIPLSLTTGSGTLSGGSAATSNGVANYTLQVGSVGSGDQLTANLTLDSNPAVAISALSSNFDIGKATPTVGLSLSSSSITYGTSETFTATLPSSATGTVTIYNNGSTVLGMAPVNNGTASFTTSTPLGAGAYSVTASYSGDSNYNAATSSLSSLTVNQASQAITITQNVPTTAVYNTSFMVSATGGGSGNAITFTPVGGSVCSVGTVTSSSGTFTAPVTMTSGTGTCQLDLNQAGNTNYLAATQVMTGITTAQKANQTITVTTPAPAMAFYASQFTVAATASSGDAVMYSYSATSVCTNSGATFTMTSGTGTCTVNFDQAGDANYNAAAEVQESVTAEKVPQTITFGALSDQTFGDPPFTVSATASSGLAVVFSSTTPSVCTTSGANGSTVTMIAAGTCTIEADQLGNMNYLAAASVTQSFNVNKAITSTALSSSDASAAVAGEPVTFTVNVSDNSSGMGTPTGTVTISDGTNAIGLITLNSSGGGTFTTALLSSTGSPHSINAHYNGDPDFQTSDATAVQQTINTRGTSTTLAFNPPQGTFEAPDTITATVTETSGLPGPSGTPDSFASSGSLGTGRKGATATQLLSGLVLVAGGEDASGNVLGSAELYNPATGTSVPSGGTLGTARYGAAAALLADGRVLIAGGTDGSIALTSAEIYNPATDSFSPTGSLSTARNAATATLLSTGKVVVIGGSDGSSAQSSVDVFDPTASSGTGAFSSPGSGGLATPRFGQAAALLANGTILVAGGNDGSGALSSAEIYDPTANTSSALAATLSVAREYAGGALMPNGYVLVAGGDSDGSTPLTSADLYDPQAQKFYASNGSLATARTQLAVVQLNDGQALAVGGAGTTPPSSNAALASVEAYTPAFTPQGAVALSSTVSGDSFTGTCQLQPATPATGPAQSTCSETINPGSAGTDNVTGNYPADAVHSSSTGGAISFTVNPATTATTVSSSSPSSIYGQAVTFTAVVSNTSTGSTGIPTGTVSFTIDGVGSVAGALAGCPSGSPTYSLCFTYSTASLMVTGSPHSITAAYSNSDGNFKGSSGSLASGQTVTPAPTSTTVASSLNPSTFGLSVTFTATVTNTAAGGVSTATPTGTVQFYVDGTAFGAPVALTGSGASVTATSGATSSLSVNSGSPHAITAKYCNTDGNFTNSNDNATPLEQVVNKADTATSVASSLNPSVYGQTVTFTATVADATTGSTGAPTGTVQFSIDGAAYGSPVSVGACSPIVANAVCASFSTHALTVPSHSITAAYSGDPNFNATGSGKSTATGTTQTVNPAQLTITASSGSMTYGNPSVFVVMPMYSGFVNGEGPSNLTTQATCLPVFTGSTQAGTYTSTCSGAADSNYSITYMTGNVMVTQATTTTTVVSSVTPSIFKQLVTFTATVTPQYSGAPTQTVTFYNNGVSIGTGTLSPTLCGTPPCPDQATFSISSLPDSGPDSITATYGGDTNFTGSTSTPITQTVQPAPEVSLNPVSLSFGNQNLNTSSTPATITLLNTGDAALTISTNGISITGDDASEFNETNNCGSSVQANGGSCTITVTFKPTATGVATATLGITDNDDDSSNTQQVVLLTGSGLSTIAGGSLYTDAVFATSNGCGGITMSGGSTVDSFNSSQGYSSSHLLGGGNVGTNGNITLNGGKSTIYGTAAVDSMTTGNCSKSSVTGLTTSGGAQVTNNLVALNGPITYPAPPAPNPAPPTTNQNISGSCPSGMAGCTTTGSKTVSLSPGQYGNLSIGGGTTAHFSEGTYNINSLTLTGNSILHVDSGPVVIKLAGASLSGGNPAMDVSGGSIQNSTYIPANLQFTYAGSQGLNLSGGAGSYATVYAPSALVNMSGGSDFFGSIVGATVTNSGGTAIHYDTNLPDIQGGRYIWFTAVANKVNLGGATGQVKLYLTNSTISFTANGTSYSVPVPNGVVTFNSMSQSSGGKTTYDLTNSRWSTAVAQSGLTGNTFVTGVAFQVPADFPTGIQNVTWSAAFSTDTPGITLQWQWGAAVFSSLSTTYAIPSGTTNALGVNAEDGSADLYGTDPAGTPETYKTYETFGGTLGYLSAGAGVVPTVAQMSVSPSSLNFGAQSQGTPTTTPLTAVLTNNDSNTHNFTGSGIQLTGTNASDFTLVPNGSSTPNNCVVMSSLTSGANCTLYVTFTPSDVGTRTAKIVVNDDANNNPQTVYLTGSGQ